MQPTATSIAAFEAAMDHRPACYIYIDNSYMFIEGQKAHAQLNGLHVPADPRLRINMANLTKELCGPHRRVARSSLYGSEAQSLGTVWTSFKNAKTDVQVFHRSRITGKEKLVDAQLVADLTVLSLDAETDESATAVVLTGDQNILVACRMLLQNTNMNIELYAYEHSCSAQFHRLREEFSERVQVVALDPILPRVSFVNTHWDESKKRIPAERSLVLDFTTLLDKSHKHTSTTLAAASATTSDDSADEEFANAYASNFMQRVVTPSSKESALVAGRLDELGRTRVQDECAHILTSLLKYPVMSCWRDKTHLIASVVTSETHGHYNFSDIITPLARVQQSVNSALKEKRVPFAVSLVTFTQFSNPAASHSDATVAFQLESVTSSPRSAHVGAGTVADAIEFGLTLSSSDSDSDSDSETPEAVSSPELIKRSPQVHRKTETEQPLATSPPQDDEWSTVRGNESLPSRRQRAMYSEVCRHGFSCRSGLRCNFTHSPNEREFFKLNGGCGTPGYKLKPCRNRACKHASAPHLCSYAHPRDVPQA